MQCSAVHCSAVQCSTVQCSEVQCSTLQCTALHCTLLHCTAWNASLKIWKKQSNVDFGSVFITLPQGEVLRTFSKFKSRKSFPVSSSCFDVWYSYCFTLINVQCGEMIRENLQWFQQCILSIYCLKIVINLSCQGVVFSSRSCYTSQETKRKH